MPNPIPHPIRGCTPHYKNLDTTEQQLKIHRLHDQKFEFEPKSFENVEEVTLTPGSILYFPAGYWYFAFMYEVTPRHRVECSDDSISINISLVANNWADLVTGGIHQTL